MTGSSSVVIGNLAYLVGAVVLAVVLGFVVWYRHRPPRSVESNVESFHRGLRALAPDERTVRPVGSTARPTPTGLRIQPANTGEVDEEPETAPTIDTDGATVSEPEIDAGDPADPSEPLPGEGIAEADHAVDEPVSEEPEPASTEPASTEPVPTEPVSTAPVVNLTEPAHRQPAAGEAPGDWAGVETG